LRWPAAELVDPVAGEGLAEALGDDAFADGEGVAELPQPPSTAAAHTQAAVVSKRARTGLRTDMPVRALPR
jgi:hypothetical protein